MCPPPWLIPPHIARGTTAPSGLCLTSCTPPPPQLSVAFAPTFPPSCYCCAPFRCIFFASLPRLFPFPMCHHGCTGLQVTRIPEALNHAVCRGRRDSPFFLVWRHGACREGEIDRFSCGGVGHVERGRETIFRVVRGGRSGRTVRANHISRREASVHIRMRIGSALSSRFSSQHIHNGKSFVSRL